MPKTPAVAGSSPEEYRYDLFISYRHAPVDRAWAVWLHSALETYRVPRRIVEEHAVPRRIHRVFRDEEELAASASLSDDIDFALFQSRFLIVICSPRTPESQWVNKEVERFRELGRHDRILALLIEGEPSESFPKALVEIRRPVTGRSGLRRLQIEHVEPLAADVRADENGGESLSSLRRLAKFRILACLLGVRFDDLRRREQERRTRRLAVLTGVMAAVLVFVVAAASVAVIQWREAIRQRTAAVAAKLNAETQRGLADEQRALAQKLLVTANDERQKAQTYAAQLQEQIKLKDQANARAQDALQKQLAESERARLAEIDRGKQEALARKATEAAQKADEEASKASAAATTQAVRADTALARADASSLEAALSAAQADYAAGRFSQAQFSFVRIREAQLIAHKDTSAADLRLWGSFPNDPLPLLRLSSAEVAVQFTTDGNHLIAVARDGRVNRIDLSRARIESAIKATGLKESVYAARLSGNRSRLFSLYTDGANRGMVEVDIEKLKVMDSIAFPAGVFAPNVIANSGLPLIEVSTPPTLVTARAHPWVTWYVTPSSNSPLHLDGPRYTADEITMRNPPRAAPACSPDGTWVVGAECAGVTIWPLTSDGTVRQLPKGDKDLFPTCAIGAAGKDGVFVGSEDGSLNFWPLNSADGRRRWAGHRAAVTAMAATGDGRRLVSFADDGTIASSDTLAGKCELTIRTGLTVIHDSSHTAVGASDASGVDVSPQGDLAVAWVKDPRIQRERMAVVNLKPEPGYRALPIQPGVVNLVRFSSDGKMVISSLAGWDPQNPTPMPASVAERTQAVCVWDVATGQLVAEFDPKEAVACVDLSADCSKLVVGTYSGSLQVIQLIGARKVISRKTGAAAVTGVSFSADGAKVFYAANGKQSAWEFAPQPSPSRQEADHTSDSAPNAPGKGGAAVPDPMTTVPATAPAQPDPEPLRENLRGVGSNLGQLFLAEHSARRTAGTLAHREYRDFGDDFVGSAAWAISPDGTRLIAGNDFGELRIWDFEYAATVQDSVASAETAIAALATNPKSAPSLRELGLWYALRNRNDWAASALTSARDAGASVSSLLIARCFWLSGDLIHAAQEYERALRQNEAPEGYLRLCIQAIKQNTPAPPKRPAGR